MSLPAEEIEMSKAMKALSDIAGQASAYAKAEREEDERATQLRSEMYAAKSASEKATKDKEAAKERLRGLVAALIRAGNDAPRREDGRGSYQASDAENARTCFTLRTRFGSVYVNRSNTSGKCYKWTAEAYPFIDSQRHGDSVTLYEVNGTSNADKQGEQYAAATKAAEAWIKTRTADAVLVSEFGLDPSDVPSPSEFLSVDSYVRVGGGFSSHGTYFVTSWTINGPNGVEVSKIDNLRDLAPIGKGFKEDQAWITEHFDAQPEYEETNTETREATEAWADAQSDRILAAWLERQTPREAVTA